jgi:GNAT superfamily N-acetyltransferase
MKHRLNGTSELPPGTIATIVTYLEMRAAPSVRPAAREEWSLVPLTANLVRYRALFRRVGEPWLWFTRLIMADQVLGRIIGDPRVAAFALQVDGEDLGLLELDFRRAGECELSFFGLVPEAVGQGWGRVLMNEAIRRAWKAPISRLWVHTCTLDHPRALGFYMRSGFRPYKRSVEIAEDPRLKGYLPLAAAPHMPPITQADDTRGPVRLSLTGWSGRRGRRA